jgi:hypothetical protein
MTIAPKPNFGALWTSALNMRFLRTVAIVVLIAGAAPAGFGGYFYLVNPVEQRTKQYSNEQQSLLAEAEIVEGTARERELMTEYDEGKGVTELAWQHARQTRQAAMLGAAGGISLIIVSAAAFFFFAKANNSGAA